MKYDYLIVGAGLFGAVFAHEARKSGKKVLVVDKRNHIGGNVYTKDINGIQVHQYGAHIFHTNDKKIWEYMLQFAEFNRYTNSPIARYKDELYNLPFNMNTFSKMWGITTPEEARLKIEEQRLKSGITTPKNLEEQAISLVGVDIYEKLIKGYTAKQWGRSCIDLPPEIIRRLPVRFVYDNNYFNDLYQGIPIGGYTPIIEKMLSGIDIRLNVDFLDDKKYLNSLANKTVFTGMIDAYFDYDFGELEYRSLNFETKILNMDNFQGNAVVNYTDYETPYTRIIEHKHFDFNSYKEQNNSSPKTVISYEYPKDWTRGDEPYYPINDAKNNLLFSKYAAYAKKEKNTIFGGRLGQYKYLDMHQVISTALNTAKLEL